MHGSVARPPRTPSRLRLTPLSRLVFSRLTDSYEFAADEDTVQLVLVKDAAHRP